MAETITLTTPIVPPKQTTIHLERLTIDIDAQSILMQWKANDGSPGSAIYSTPSPSAAPSGATLISQLNTANLSTTSLVKRVLQRLLLDGYIAAGTIVGVPT